MISSFKIKFLNSVNNFSTKGDESQYNILTKIDKS